MLKLEDIIEENKKYEHIKRFIKELINSYNMEISDILYLLNLDVNNNSKNNSIKNIIIQLKKNIIYTNYYEHNIYLDEKIIILQKVLFNKNMKIIDKS